MSRGYKSGAAHHRAKASTSYVSAVRHLRERYGMSFQQISAQLGVSMWTVRDWCEYRTRVSG